MAKKKSCISCTALYRCNRLRKAPCGHWYCPDCIQRMSRLALLDRALVPIRCCGKELPIDYVEEALSPTSDYQKYLEFLGDKDWKSSDLTSDAEYADAVKNDGAKQCPGCGIGVLRIDGCIHMTCPHGHQFCYTCLKVWQTCSCPNLPDEEVMRALGEI